MTKIVKTGCCDPFDPTPWEDKEFSWQNKLFVHDYYRSFLHIPLNIKGKIIKNVQLIEAAQAKPEQFIFLADEKSLWGSNMYLAATKDVPGAKMTTLSGAFFSKVFEGPYSQESKWVKEMKAYVAAKNKELDQIYFFYTTCPKCAKAYGKNYVVLLARVK